MRSTLVCLAFAFVSAVATTSVAAPHYPMPAEDFQETISKRIETTWNKIEKKLQKSRVSEQRIEEIRKVFDEVVEPLNEALDKASADGSITRGEAYRINVMTSGLRGKLRGKLAIERAAPQKAEPKQSEATRRKAADDKDEEVDSEDPPPRSKTAPSRKPAASPKGKPPARSSKARR